MNKTELRAKEVARTYLNESLMALLNYNGGLVAKTEGEKQEIERYLQEYVSKINEIIK